MQNFFSIDFAGVEMRLKEKMIEVESPCRFDEQRDCLESPGDDLCLACLRVETMKARAAMEYLKTLEDKNESI